MRLREKLIDCLCIIGISAYLIALATDFISDKIYILHNLFKYGYLYFFAAIGIFTFYRTLRRWM